MPSLPAASQVHVSNIATCLATTVNTLRVLSANLKVPFLVVITNTAQSLLEHAQTIKQNKSDCIRLLEQSHDLLDAVIVLHIKSDTGGNLPPKMLNHLSKFTETLQKIDTFIEVQQTGSKIRMFFRQGEMNTLLKDCEAGLQQGLDALKVDTADLITDISRIQQLAEDRHREVLCLLDTVSDNSSLFSGIYSGSYTSSNSISLLPSEPKIFHGRELELEEILQQFNRTTPRIAILGPAGMGKTSLARAILHHTDITARFQQRRVFVACDSATSKVELANLIGAHLELKPGKDLTQAVVHYFSQSPLGLLILDNLETVWEPKQSRKEIEEFLSLLTGINHLALLITMRGAERPAKVLWTRPFVQPLQPLVQGAARQMFVDIADDWHNPAEVDKILSLTDNMPLAISLLASLADVEGCSKVLSRWVEEKTSMLSNGNDRRSNLDLSISFSLLSPRIRSEPDSLQLLSLLSMLPDGLSDVELIQSHLPIKDISRCKTALICASLAYIDGYRVKVLVPIREHVQSAHPAAPHMIHSLLNHFHELLESHKTSLSAQVVARISSNYANIQKVVSNGLRSGHPDLDNSIYSACLLSYFSQNVGRGGLPLMKELYESFPSCCGHRPKVYFISHLLSSPTYYAITSAEALTTEALEHFSHFNDPDLKCELYLNLNRYYMSHQAILMGQSFSQNALSLARSTGNTKRQSEALTQIAWNKWTVGDYHTAQRYAHESQRLAKSYANLYQEAHALKIEAQCWGGLCNYQESLFLCNRARDLVARCGISAGGLDHAIMTSQAA
ncbi:hypothetical protein DFH06DRAFT_434720, partial [Mycena polygramma]